MFHTLDSTNLSERLDSTHSRHVLGLLRAPKGPITGQPATVHDRQARRNPHHERSPHANYLSNCLSGRPPASACTHIAHAPNDATTPQTCTRQPTPQQTDPAPHYSVPGICTTRHLHNHRSSVARRYQHVDPTYCELSLELSLRSAAPLACCVVWPKQARPA